MAEATIGLLLLGLGVTHLPTELITVDVHVQVSSLVSQATGYLAGSRPLVGSPRAPTAALSNAPLGNNDAGDWPSACPSTTACCVSMGSTVAVPAAASPFSNAVSA